MQKVINICDRCKKEELVERDKLSSVRHKIVVKVGEYNQLFQATWCDQCVHDTGIYTFQERELKAREIKNHTIQPVTLEQLLIELIQEVSQETVENELNRR